MDFHNGMVTTGQGTGPMTPNQVLTKRDELMAPVVKIINDLLVEGLYDRSAHVTILVSEVLEQLELAGINEALVHGDNLLSGIPSAFQASGWDVTTETNGWVFKIDQASSLPTYRSPGTVDPYA